MSVHRWERARKPQDLGLPRLWEWAGVPRYDDGEGTSDLPEIAQSERDDDPSERHARRLVAVVDAPQCASSPTTTAAATEQEGPHARDDRRELQE